MLPRVQGDHLVDADAVERARPGIMQRRPGQPHVGTQVRIGLGSGGVVQPPQETQLAAKRSQGLGRFPKLESLALRLREPTPIRNPMIRIGQAHPVRGVERTETGGSLPHLGSPHGLQPGERECHPGKSLQNRPSIKFVSHDSRPRDWLTGKTRHRHPTLGERVAGGSHFFRNRSLWTTDRNRSRRGYPWSR